MTNVTEVMSKCRAMDPETAWGVMIGIWRRENVAEEWNAVIRSSVVYDMVRASKGLANGTDRVAGLLDDLLVRVTGDKVDDDAFLDALALAREMNCLSVVEDAVSRLKECENGLERASRLLRIAHAVGFSFNVR